jgi:hypothetical protein
MAGKSNDGTGCFEFRLGFWDSRWRQRRVGDAMMLAAWNIMDRARARCGLDRGWSKWRRGIDGGDGGEG